MGRPSAVSDGTFRITGAAQHGGSEISSLADMRAPSGLGEMRDVLRRLSDIQTSKRLHGDRQTHLARTAHMQPATYLADRQVHVYTRGTRNDVHLRTWRPSSPIY